MNANVITANRPITYAVALPRPKYEPLPATAQNTRSPGPTSSADDRERDRERGQRGGDAAPAALLPREVEHGDEGGGAGLLGEGRDCDREARAARSTTRREQERRGHRRQHEDLEVRRLPVLWRERDRRGDEEQRREPGRPLAPASARLGGEQERRQRDRQHRDDADRPEGGAAHRRECRRVQVRHERWLAVGRVLVEGAAVADDLGLGGEEGLVGVEDRDEEGREAQQRGQQEHRDDESSSVGPGARVDRSGVENGGCELGRHQGPQDGGVPF